MGAPKQKLVLFLFCETRGPLFCIFCRHKGGKRDKSTILDTSTTVGVWNSIIFYLAAPIPISPNFAGPPNKGVNDFAFVVGTRVEKETNQLSLTL